MRDEEDEQAKKRHLKSLEKAMISGASGETVQRYGSAIKGHLVSFSGKDNETNVTLQKSLKSISKFKLSSDKPMREINIKQQAGFSAEVKSVPRKNAERIIQGEKARFVRSDDIGKVNDQIYDLLEIEESGFKISGSGSQMKFVGKNPEDLLKKLSSKDYNKYFKAGAIIDIPDDDYAKLMGSMGLIDQEIGKIETQIKAVKSSGNIKVQKSLEEKLKKTKEIKSSIRKSGLTRADAIEARLHPRMSVAKDVVKLSHRAGMEQMKYGAAVSGSISLIRNLVAYARGNKDAEDVIIDTGFDTAKGAGMAYANAFASSTLKATMQNSSSSYLKALSKTNVATGIVTAAVDITSSLSKYVKGDLSGAECIEELGEKGFGQLGAAVYSSISLISVPSKAPMIMKIAGGMTGATFGYIAATAVYKELSTSLKEAKIAHEERLIIEKECAEAIEMIKEYRKEMNAMVTKYLSENITMFNDCFEQIDNAIITGDIDGFICSNTKVQEKLGRETQFSNKDEFDLVMESDENFKL